MTTVLSDRVHARTKHPLHIRTWSHDEHRRHLEADNGLKNVHPSLHPSLCWSCVREISFFSVLTAQSPCQRGPEADTIYNEACLRLSCSLKRKMPRSIRRTTKASDSMNSLPKTLRPASQVVRVPHASSSSRSWLQRRRQPLPRRSPRRVRSSCGSKVSVVYKRVVGGRFAPQASACAHVALQCCWFACKCEAQRFYVFSSGRRVTDGEVLRQSCCRLT